MKSAFRLGAYAIVCLSIFALAPQGKSQTYQGKELVKAELIGRYQRSCSRETFYRRFAASNGSRLAHLLEIFRRRRPSDRDQMELAGRVGKRAKSNGRFR